MSVATISTIATIHTNLNSASASLPIGNILISCKWKETAKQTRKERAVSIPFESVKSPEVPESFRALVESVLLSQAEITLKSFCDSNPNSFEIPLSLFNRDTLTQNAIAKSSDWMTKEELEMSFTQSFTWKRIVSNPNFANNAIFQTQANRFKETILKLSGKATVLDSEKCDLILSKISDEDLESKFGEFVVNRLVSFKNKKDDSFDLSAL